MAKRDKQATKVKGKPRALASTSTSKPPPSSTTTTATTTAPIAPAPPPFPALPLETHQALLALVRETFNARFNGALAEDIQSVKAALFKRDFEGAFGTEEGREAYVVRWSAGRAGCYAGIFAEAVRGAVGRRIGAGRGGGGEDGKEGVRVVCVGGGAGAELLGLVGAVRMLKEGRGLDCKVTVVLVDVADWGACVERLAGALGDEVAVEFVRRDVLSLRSEEVGNLVRGADLITVMFTLGEMYAASVPDTQGFLAAVGEGLSPGAGVLVVDSAGSYGEVEIGEKGRRYPLGWLVDWTFMQLVVEVHEQVGLRMGASRQPLCEIEYMMESEMRDEEQEKFISPDMAVFTDRPSATGQAGALNTDIFGFTASAPGASGSSLPVARRLPVVRKVQRRP
ncbi:hypothetical protein EJ06DRAFT_551349 [Trichodelitschia bisporula]|uniref:S-adenosyl-L-methionine-dependent methyltransferase n=1 Tax=Trichodelitschia bisporula TaxID=703511 RepID=A0A6G1HLN4_9PEZI|nr:hypothetical protein EJ06DRAFT_551349 [Trichodelitschia bisporula]